MEWPCFKKGDEAHLAAMNKMKSTMQEEGAFEKWLSERKADFDSLPNI
jgi:hypothetical protein